MKDYNSHSVIFLWSSVLLIASWYLISFLAGKGASIRTKSSSMPTNVRTCDGPSFFFMPLEPQYETAQSILMKKCSNIWQLTLNPMGQCAAIVILFPPNKPNVSLTKITVRVQLMNNVSGIVNWVIDDCYMCPANASINRSNSLVGQVINQSQLSWNFLWYQTNWSK